MKKEAIKSKFCLGCGLKYDYDAPNYCGECGGEIVDIRVGFEYSTCRICGKKIYIPIGASMPLCDYHWEIYDAKIGRASCRERV